MVHGLVDGERVSDKNGLLEMDFNGGVGGGPVRLAGRGVDHHRRRGRWPAAWRNGGSEAEQSSCHGG